MILTAAQADTPEAGGKGANLGRLIAAGFDVPAFIVLPDAAFEGDDPPAGRIDFLQSHLPGLPQGTYAVRSSGQEEDGAEHSHAGQFDTQLNVAPDALIEAIAQVRQSGDGARLATYRAEKGLAEGSRPAVLIQCMVPARLSGVAFSADPIKGLRDRVVISATEGLGEALVSGEVDGETWIIGTNDVIERPDTQVLTEAEAREVAALARAAEAAFGAPQDIEWAYDGDRLYILQSRAITTPLRPAPLPDPAMVVLDNSNIIESYPGLVSPLTYTFASYAYDRVYRGFVGLLGLSDAEVAANAAVFANLLTRVDGRVYYNLGNWYRALALLPGFSLNRDFMETMMGLSEPLPADLTEALAPPPSTGLARARDMGRVVWILCGLGWQALRLKGTKRRFMARLDAALVLDVRQMSLTDLAAHYRRIEAALLDQWDAPLVNDFLCMIAFGASRKLLQRWGGPDGLAFHNELMIGQGDIISAEPAKRIAQMAALARQAPGAAEALQHGRAGLAAFPDLAREVDAYLEKFGARCTQELKLESIPLTEDPSPLLAAVAAGAAREAPAAHVRPDPDWAGLLPNALRRRVAQAVTHYARARVRDRENLRFERTRIFGHAREVFLAMGAQFHARGDLEDPRDIFYLTVSEVLGVVEGAALSPDLMGLVALRRAEMTAAATRPDPPERLQLRGAAHGRGQSKPPDQATGDARTGTGCSAGTITGRARVIHDPRTESLEAGEILIARSTDPGWIAVFVNASAIVVERGSLLSHSAIVAREMGIPCVVGIADATRWLATGDQISVDGATGLVEKRHG